MAETTTLFPKNIQLKRGTCEALCALLTGENKPLLGELIYEVPSEDYPNGRLKIGDGVQNYQALAYLPNTVELNQLVEEIRNAKDEVIALEAATEEWASKAVLAKDAAVEAAQEVKNIPEKTMQQVNTYMNQKLHFMSAEEYNQLEKIDRDGFYFITIDN